MRNITFITGTLYSVAHKNINGKPVSLFILQNEDTLIKCKALGEVSEKAKDIFNKDGIFTVVGSVTSKVINGEISQTGVDVFHISEGDGLTRGYEEDILLSDIINVMYGIVEEEYPKKNIPLIIDFYLRANNNIKAYLRGRWGLPKEKK